MEEINEKIKKATSLKDEIYKLENFIACCIEGQERARKGIECDSYFEEIYSRMALYWKQWWGL